MEETQELKSMDLIKVMEITRPQVERVESFISVLREASEKFKIGHSILVYEIEVDGAPRLGMLTNTELQDLLGETGELRVVELLMLAVSHFVHHGIPPLAIGIEPGLEAMRAAQTKHDLEETK